jgi:glycogen debranching enzyme
MSIEARGPIAADMEHLSVFKHARAEQAMVEAAPAVVAPNRLLKHDDTFFVPDGRGDSSLSVDLANHDLIAGDHATVAKDTIHVLRTILMWRGTAYQRFAVRNYCGRPAHLQFTLLFAGDFADIFEVRGTPRANRGVSSVRTRDGNHVEIEYRGLDRVTRSTVLSFDPPPRHLARDQATYDARIAAGAAMTFFVAVKCESPRDDARSAPV